MDPANAKFVCGAECGIAAVGTLSAGTEHWSTVGGTAPTISTTTFNSAGGGIRSFRFNPSAALSYLQSTFATVIPSPATTVARFYIRFATLPSADTLIFGENAGIGVMFKSSDSTLRACCDSSGGSNAASGAVVTTGVWYRVDVKAVQDNTRTSDIQVDGVAQAQATIGSGASSSANFTIGAFATVTADFFVDDLIVSGTAADYPIGAGSVRGLYPVADRTNTAANPTDGNTGHLFSATTDFGKGVGGATATGAQNAESTSWQSLQNPLSTTTPGSFIADLLGASTEHMVWELGDLPADALTINGVMLVVTTHSASATTNEFRCGLAMAASSIRQTCIGPLDLSETTITVPVSVRTLPPTGGWSVAAANGLQAWFGDSTDVNPDPFLDGVCVEIDYLAYAPKVVIVRQAVQRAAVR